MDGPATPRSTFVTVVGWLFVAFSGFGTLIGVLQNLMLHLFFPLAQMRQDLPADAGLPPMFQFLAAHFAWFFALALANNAAMLVASIGLLRRRNWARLLFIGLLVLGIASSVAGVAVQQAFMSEMMAMPGMHDLPAEAHADMQAQMQGMLIFMRVFGIGLTVAMAAVLGWIAWKLCTPQIVAEFRRAR